MEIYERLTAMRVEKGLTLQDVEARSGIPFQTVRRIFDGSTRDPGISTMHAIVVKGLGYKLDDLYGEWPPENEKAEAQVGAPAVVHHHFNIMPLHGDVKAITQDAITDVVSGEAYKIVHNNLKWWRTIALVLILLVLIWFTWDVTHPDVGLIQYGSAAPITTGWGEDPMIRA